MLFFFHLFAGIIFGLLVGDLLHDRRWILPCIIGAVLPDLIDKPVGYFFFADLFGNGRIFMHSIVMVSLLLLFGFLAWKYWHHPEVLAVAFGILFHQVLDQMWEVPEDWYFPLFGVSPSNRGADYALVLVLRDFRFGSEWFFIFIIICSIILVLASRYAGNLLSRHRHALAWLTGAGAIVCVIIAGITIGTGIALLKRSFFLFFRFFGWDTSFEFFIGGIVFLMCALLLWRMRSHLLEDTRTG